MKVLHVIDSAGLYGAETVLLNLAGEQQQMGLEPVILSVGNKRAREKDIEIQANRRGIPCFALRMYDGPNFAGARRIVRLATQERADVVHSHGYKSNILLGLLPGFMRSMPLVATLHGWTAVNGTAGFSRMGLYRYIDQKVLSRLDAVVPVSQELQRSPAVMRLPSAKVHHIPNGIQMERPAMSADDPLGRTLLAERSRGLLVLGVIGRLSHEKNVTTLLAAIAQLANRLPQIRLFVLGNGPERGRLEEQVRAAGIDRQVVLQGYVENASQYLPLLDALVLPSLTEGLPMVLLEAMAAQTPVIASAVGGIPSTLNGLGLLVEPGNTDALAAAIENFAADAARYKEQAAIARSRVEAEYSARAMATRYNAVYRSVMKQDP